MASQSGEPECLERKVPDQRQILEENLREAQRIVDSILSTSRGQSTYGNSLWRLRDNLSNALLVVNNATEE